MQLIASRIIWLAPSDIEPELLVQRGSRKNKIEPWKTPLAFQNITETDRLWSVLHSRQVLCVYFFICLLSENLLSIFTWELEFDRIQLDVSSILQLCVPPLHKTSLIICNSVQGPKAAFRFTYGFSGKLLSAVCFWSQYDLLSVCLELYKEHLILISPIHGRAIKNNQAVTWLGFRSLSLFSFCFD